MLRVLALPLAIVLSLLAGPGPARAETEVDLALVIAVDVSFSMDPDEQELQRGGFVDAFRSAVVQEAIGRGAVGRIAVAYVEWAGASDQRLVMPWTVLDSPAATLAFADAIAGKPQRRAARTSISGALDFASRLFDGGGFAATRQVIDVSGDGPNNQGRPIGEARADALARGITVNGLPLMLKAPGYFDIAELDLYYRDCVIGGQGAFMVPVRDKNQLRDAVKTKIIMEIAEQPVPGPAPTRFGGGRVILAQAEGPAAVRPGIGGGTDARCSQGERQWRDRMGN